MHTTWWQPENRLLISRYLKRFRPYRRGNRHLIYPAAFGSLLTTSVGLLLPWITMEAIDRIVYSGEISTMVYLLLAWVGTILLKGVGNFLSFFNLMVFRQRMITQGQTALLKHLLRVPLQYFNTVNVGYAVCRIRDDISALHPFWAGTLINVIRNTITVLVSLTLLFTINTKLTLIILILAPVYLLGSFLFLKRVRQLSYEVNELAGDAEGTLHESISGAAIVKQLGLERRATRDYLRRLKEMIRARVRLELLEHIKENLGQVLRALVPVVIFCYSGYLIYLKSLTVGEFVGYTVYVGLLLTPLSQLFNMNTKLQRALAPLQRVFEILDIEPEPGAVSGGAARGHMLRGDIVYHAVTFSYGESTPALRNISLHIEQESVVGFCGTSGAGKSTVVNLLLRFYEPQEGRILIDDRSIQDIPLQVLRRSISIVSQDLFLFNDTIISNLSYGAGNVTREQIEQAARLARAHEFISALPRQYDTVVGVRGLKLSGGQRARLSIARVLLRKPSIVVLDEATSFLDSQTERLLRDATAELFQDRTIIIVSHRMSSIRHADRIFVFEDGRIVQQGTPTELESIDGLYRQLCEEQMKHGVADSSNGKVDMRVQRASVAKE